MTRTIRRHAINISSTRPLALLVTLAAALASGPAAADDHEDAAPVAEAEAPAPAPVVEEAETAIVSEVESAPVEVTDRPAGPELDLPVEDPAGPEPPTPGDPGIQWFGGKTTLGGYAELHYNHVRPDGGDPSGEVDFHRMVLFVGHRFNDWLRFRSEIEVEHSDEIYLEQAALDFDLVGEALTLRTGVVLIPMGIINATHEPPTFHGVERPATDARIIPSTWREAAVGFVGKPIEGLSYEVYLASGFNPLKFSESSGLRGGRQKVSNATFNSPALTGRVQYQPMLGLVVGLAGYYADAGPNAGAVFDGNGNPLDLKVPVLGYAADARWKWKGIEARAVYANFSITGTDLLRAAHDADGGRIGPDVGSTIYGGYAEIAYDVLSLADTTHQLLPFFRYEAYDTMATVSWRERTDSDDARNIRDLVFGVSYRPVPAVAFKADVISRSKGGNGTNETVIDLGIGLMF